MAPLAGESDTTEVIKAVGGSVTFRIPSTDRNTDGNAALWFFENEPIATVEFKAPFQPEFHKQEFETRFAVSENGLALTISELTMEDAGTYSVTIEDKTSAFTLQVFRELPEPTVTCKAHNHSDGSCHHYLRCSVPGPDFRNVSCTWDQPWAEESLLLVNESSWDNLEPLTCTAQNPVSSRNVTVTNPRVLCAGAPSGSSVRIGVFFGIGALVLFFVLLACLVVYCKSRGLCMKERRRSSAGCQDSSRSVTGDRLIDSERQAEESDGDPEVDQPFGAIQH